jgi:myo-inositol-1(or 4)-monophosphatase
MHSLLLEYQSFALQLAKQAGELITTHFRLGMKKEWKQDNSPVTETDHRINQMVLDAVAEQFPTHSVIAEEGSHTVNGSDYTWICDPIDGTIPFSHGVPTCVFSLALTYRGEVILGIIFDPFMNRLLLGEKGKTSTLNGKPIHVSSSPLEIHNTVVLETPHQLSYDLSPIRQKLRQKGIKLLSLGSTVYGGMLVASGECVANIFSGNKPHDAAAIKIIVEGAGGKVTNIFGKEQRYDQEIQGCIASNGVAHDEVLNLIRETVLGN